MRGREENLEKNAVSGGGNVERKVRGESKGEREWTPGRGVVTARGVAPSRRRGRVLRLQWSTSRRATGLGRGEAAPSESPGSDQEPEELGAGQARARPPAPRFHC